MLITQVDNKTSVCRLERLFYYLLLYHLMFVGLSICVTCPDGYQCSDPAVSPVICPVGSVATSGKAVCSGCDGGYQLLAGICFSVAVTLLFKLPLH
jgi:hypothetical protein